MRPEREQRPGGESQALNDCVAAVNHIVEDSTPCERCGRPLWAPASVERGTGPVCCRAVA